MNKLILISTFIIAFFSYNMFYSGLVSSSSVALNTDSSYAFPIIMYHSTWNKNPNKYSVTPTTFENDLIFLIKNGFTTIVVKDLINYIENGTPLPDKPVMLTFDDGYKTNYLYAYPLLKKYQMKAIFSIVGKYTDDNYDKNGKVKNSCGHMTYEEIKEVSDSGYVEIQNHTYNLHGDIDGRCAMGKKSSETFKDYDNAISKDLIKFQDRMKEKTGITCTAVTYPFGKYSLYTVDVLKHLGFMASFSCTEGINVISKNSELFNLKRYNRPSGISTAKYFNKILANCTK